MFMFSLKWERLHITREFGSHGCFVVNMVLTYNIQIAHNVAKLLNLNEINGFPL